MSRPMMFRPQIFRPLLLSALLLICGQASATELTVFAAASLTDAFGELGRAFTARSGHSVTFQFAGSQLLRTQLENGARADVYASANDAQYRPLVDSGLLASGRVFARNKLTLIAPKNNMLVRTLADLGRPGVRLVIADKGVPAGDYTRRMLNAVERSGSYGRDFLSRTLRNVVSEESSVRQVALKVQLGEADAAVVYQSDAVPSLRAAVRVIALPSRFNQSASYPVGMLRNSASPDAAQAFVDYTLSAAGQSILRKWGFLSPQ